MMWGPLPDDWAAVVCVCTCTGNNGTAIARMGRGVADMVLLVSLTWLVVGTSAAAGAKVFTVSPHLVLLASIAAHAAVSVRFVAVPQPTPRRSCSPFISQQLGVTWQSN